MVLNRTTLRAPFDLTELDNGLITVASLILT